jgi:hypothetical protein
MSSLMTPVPEGDPLRVAWDKYKATADYQNTRKWALDPDHVDGSLWAAFVAGWLARNEKDKEPNE